MTVERNEWRYCVEGGEEIITRQGAEFTSPTNVIRSAPSMRIRGYSVA